MPKTADIKIRIAPDLKQSATDVYSRWGLNLSDAVTIFLNQSVAVGGLPFAMRPPVKVHWDNPSIIGIDEAYGHAVLPAEWDAPEDSAYDELA